LEAVGNAEVPLDQSTDLLDRQASVLWKGFQHLLECLKGWESIQKAFHKLLLLLAREAYVLPSCAAGCPSVASRYFQPESAEGSPKGLVTELLHKGSYILLLIHAFDCQKVFEPREQQVGGNAAVPATMLRNRYTSVCNLLTNLHFHFLREEALLPIQLLLQRRKRKVS
jgi:hypothetical protein